MSFIQKEQDTIVARKFYAKPEVIHELELETRAGSPHPGTGFLDPLELNDDGE